MINSFELENYSCENFMVQNFFECSIGDSSELTALRDFVRSKLHVLWNFCLEIKSEKLLSKTLTNYFFLQKVENIIELKRLLNEETVEERIPH